MNDRNFTIVQTLYNTEELAIDRTTGEESHRQIKAKALPAIRRALEANHV